MPNIPRFTTVLTLTLIAGLHAQATIFRVDASALGNENGSSWEHAFVDLQDALGLAASGDEIWVAAGIYRPSSQQDPAESFALGDGVGLFGGFSGMESSREQRDWEANPTILSGELSAASNDFFGDRPTFGADDSAEEMYDPLRRWADQVLRHSGKLRAERSYNVVRAEGVGSSTVIDGFTISHGFSGDGAGMFLRAASPMIRNVELSQNGLSEYGGGMAMYEGSAPSLENVSFIANTAWWGGGLYSVDSAPQLTDVVFRENYGLSRMGGADIRDATAQISLRRVSFSDNLAGDAVGALHVVGELSYVGGIIEGNYVEDYDGGGAVLRGPSKLVNLVVSDNVAAGSGAGILSDGALELINVTATGNRAGRLGGALYIIGGSASIKNSLLWGNLSGWTPPETPFQDTLHLAGGSLSVSHSVVQGCGGSGASWVAAIGSDLGGNLDQDPLFANLEGGTFELDEQSPAIDAGDDSALPAGLLHDLAGNDRIVGSAVDMGAYEHQGTVEETFRSISSLKALFERP